MGKWTVTATYMDAEGAPAHTVNATQATEYGEILRDAEARLAEIDAKAEDWLRRMCEAAERAARR